MKLLIFTLPLLLPGGLMAQRQMEDLGRGVVAIRTGNSSAYVSWRMLGSDDEDVAFNLYRAANGGTPQKLNGAPLVQTTDYQDNPGSTLLTNSTLSYSVRPVIDGVEQGFSSSWTLPANTDVEPFFELPFAADPGPDGPYDTKFVWVGDFDGDGEFDFLCDRLSTTGENEQFLEAYLRDGTLLWRMHMGSNSLNQDHIEPGSSSISTGDCDNVTCFDLDGDGHAEAIVRTANGVTVTNPEGTTVASVSDGNNNRQFLSIIDGMTGVERDRIEIPNTFIADGPFNSRIFIAYLDGKTPSIFVIANNRTPGRGPFNRQWTAFDFKNGDLSLRWNWLQPPGVPGAEGHQIRIADVDNDGRDEVVDIGHAMDDDGTRLYVTDLVHGDRFHLADLNPLWPGLETFIIQQNNPTLLATAYLNASNGQFYKKWYTDSVIDVGRGLALDMDPNHLGAEMFSTQPGIFNAEGQQIFDDSIWPYEGLWWDGDTGRETIIGPNSGATSPAIEKFNPSNGGRTRIYLNGNNNVYNYSVHNGNGGRPAFWGDILGDWREELVLTKNDFTGLRVFTTTTPAQSRRRTLMHNAAYRVQTTTKGYVQGSNVDYYLGFETTEDPPPPINDTDHVWGPSDTVLNTSACPDGESILFDLTGNNSASVQLTGTLAPSRVKVFSGTDYTFGGPGSLTGAMDLLKSGAGTLALTGNHPFTGKTEVWDGALLIDGQLANSPVAVHGGTWGGPAADGLTGGRLGGSGTIGQAVELAWRGALVPGDGIGDAATLTLNGGLTLGADTVIALDLSAASSSDQLVVNGGLTLTGPTTFLINALDGSLAPGSYELISYSGGFTGSLADFTARLPDGTPFTLTNTGSAIVLVVPVTRAPGSLVWAGGSGGDIWDLFQTQNFRLNGLTEKFVSGDTVLFDATGQAHSNVTLAGPLAPAGVTVDAAANYEFAGPGYLTGSGGLTKRGSGMLTTGDDHDFTGPVVVEGGVLAITSLADAGSPSSIGAATAASGNFILNGGTVRHLGEQTATNRGLQIGSNGGTIETPSASLQIGGTISGPGILTKTGPGTLTLGAANNFCGGTVLEEGRLQLASDAANASGLGSGAITFRGGILAMTDDNSSYNSASYNLVVPAGESGRLNADGRVYLGGSLTGGGDFTFYTPFVRTDLQGNWSNFTGNLHVITDGDGGDFRIENTFGYGGAAVDLGPGVYAYYMPTMSTDIILSLGALSGDADANLRGGPTAGRTLTWRIGGKNLDATFDGSVADSESKTALTKVGNGIQTFTGALTQSGNTTISGGILRIEGTSSSSNFIVQNGGYLSGPGTITGAVTVQNNGGLELRDQPLAIDGNVFISGNLNATSSIDPGFGDHLLATYTGSFLGSPTATWTGPGNYLATVSTVGGQILLTLTPGETDADGDLIDDSWELTYYASISEAGPLDDTDGDGFNTWTEWKAGTDPTDFDSKPGSPVSSSASLHPVADTAVWYRSNVSGYASTNYGGDIDIDNYAYPGVPIIALGYFRFDLGSLPAGASIDSSTLTFTQVTSNPQQSPQGGHSDVNGTLTSGRFATYGLLDVAGNTAQDWDEFVLSGDTSGAEFDFANAANDPPVDTTIRTVDLNGVNEVVAGNTASISDGALNTFLQGRLDAATNPGLATFITDINDGNNGKGHAFNSREAASGRPELHISYTSGAPLPDTDEDGDGLDDAWEAHHFGDFDETGSDDPDGDGFNNESEESASTDPNDRSITPDDSDGDGLRDAWELANFGNLSPGPGNDADQDGTPEWLEQALDFDPKDPNEAFSMSITPDGSGDFILTWPDGDEVEFELQGSATLLPPSWGTLGAYSGVSAGGMLSQTVSPTGMGFFRVQASRR